MRATPPTAAPSWRRAREAVSAERADDGWRLTVEDRATRARRELRAKVARQRRRARGSRDVLTKTLKTKAKAKVRLVQGSHVVVRRLYDHDRCYIFQNADGRIIFAIPYERDFTLIGTTDRDYDGDPAEVRATAEEIAYLCAAASEYFARPVTPADVVWSYSGVRPLYDDGASEAKAATRDYVFDVDASVAGAPMLSVFGGKITTYRRLAESAPRQARDVPARPCAARGRGARRCRAASFHPTDGRGWRRNWPRGFRFLDERGAARLASSYGRKAFDILGKAERAEDLGRVFGAGLSEAEVRYLMTREWARNADDVLWRRSKLGLFVSAGGSSGAEIPI